MAEPQHTELVPGARTVEPEAETLLASDPELLSVVREAVAALGSAFDSAGIDIEYFADPESDEGEERVYVAVYTSQPDRLERLGRVRRDWWRRHPAFRSAPMSLTVHGV